MKAWPAVLVLGMVALLIGALMVELRLHHTIGLGAIGLGIILDVVGFVMAFRDRRAGKTGATETVVPPKPRKRFVRPLIAILVVVGIGIATFYGTSYLTSVQPGAQSSLASGPNTVSGSITEITPGGVSGSSTVSGQTPTVSASTVVISVSTESPTSQSSSSQSASTSQSESSSQSSTLQSSSSATSISQSASSSQSSTLQSSSSQSFSSSGDYPFILTAYPSVVLNGGNVTITAVYTNNGPTARTVNFYTDMRFANGTDILPGTLFYPNGPQVSPNSQLPIKTTLGPFAQGSYVITFYVIDSSYRQLSDAVTANFTVS